MEVETVATSEIPAKCTKLKSTDIERQKLARSHKRKRAIDFGLLTIPEFCTAVRISERQFFRLRAEGCGPYCTRLGGKILISREQAEQWVRKWTER